MATARDHGGGSMRVCVGGLVGEVWEVETRRSRAGRENGSFDCQGSKQIDNVIHVRRGHERKQKLPRDPLETPIAYHLVQSSRGRGEGLAEKQSKETSIHPANRFERALPWPSLAKPRGRYRNGRQTMEGVDGGVQAGHFLLPVDGPTRRLTTNQDLHNYRRLKTTCSAADVAPASPRIRVGSSATFQSHRWTHRFHPEGK
jgi:hypothetical protein